MSRDIRLYLDDILSSIQSVQKYTAHLNQKDFLADRKTFEAVAFNLQIIGEAAKQIPERYRQEYPQINWKKVVGLRNIIVHTYFSLSETVIWDISQNKLGDLSDCISQMQEQIDREISGE